VCAYLHGCVDLFQQQAALGVHAHHLTVRLPEGQAVKLGGVAEEGGNLRSMLVCRVSSLVSPTHPNKGNKHN